MGKEKIIIAAAAAVLTLAVLFMTIFALRSDEDRSGTVHIPDTTPLESFDALYAYVETYVKEIKRGHYVLTEVEATYRPGDGTDSVCFVYEQVRGLFKDTYRMTVFPGDHSMNMDFDTGSSRHGEVPKRLEAEKWRLDAEAIADTLTDGEWDELHFTTEDDRIRMHIYADDAYLCGCEVDPAYNIVLPDTVRYGG